MARKKIVINEEDIANKMDELVQDVKPYTIVSAVIKEDLCNYGYEIKNGVCSGDKIPTRKGSKVIHNDMRDAFRKLNVHLAFIDDAFKSVVVESIEDASEYELVSNYSVTGFKVAGNEENEGFIISGEKWVTHGSISLNDMPKITRATNYRFYDDLKDAIEHAIIEVEAYMNGKSGEVESEQGEFDFKDEPEDEFAEAEQ